MLTVTPTAVRLALRVQPRAARSRVVGRHGAALKVQIAAPPAEGAANAAVVALLADWLGVARRQVVILQGERGRDKLIEVATDDPPALALHITALVAGALTR
ncbi:MAG: DUF167 family protein [bacterium]